MKIITVVAAVIRRKGEVLLTSRPVSKPPLGWEFPGGKVEPGEMPEQALVRECREELGVTVAVDGVFMEVTHTYPDITVHLTLYHAAIAQGVPQKREHAQLRWITPAEIPQYAFCPADVDILARLQKEYGG